VRVRRGRKHPLKELQVELLVDYSPGAVHIEGDVGEHTEDGPVKGRTTWSGMIHCGRLRRRQRVGTTAKGDTSER
jgi:hypothetical protein